MKTNILAYNKILNSLRKKKESKKQKEKEREQRILSVPYASQLIHMDTSSFRCGICGDFSMNTDTGICDDCSNVLWNLSQFHPQMD